MTTTLPKSYKAVVLDQINCKFALQDVELRHPGPNQILVKVLACGICFSDMAIADGHFGNVFPRTPGHELVGDVVEVGENIRHITIGQRVGGPWHGGHDGSCRQCRRGQFQMCDRQAINGVNKDGGFAEYTLLQAEAAVRIPTDMDPAEVAPLLCAGVTVFNGIRKLHVEQGALVAVQGLGGLGHMAVQFANKMGYEVAALSSGNDKHDFAKKLGAHHYINTKTTDAASELASLGGAAIIVQTAPNPDVVGALVNGLSPGGKLLSLAAVGPVAIDTVALITRGRSVHGWPSGHALDSEEKIRFAKTHNVKCMVDRYPLTEAQEAIDSLRAGKPRFRNVLVMY